MILASVYQRIIHISAVTHYRAYKTSEPKKLRCMPGDCTQTTANKIKVLNGSVKREIHLSVLQLEFFPLQRVPS